METATIKIPAWEDINEQNKYLESWMEKIRPQLKTHEPFEKGKTIKLLMSSEIVMYTDDIDKIVVLFEETLQWDAEAKMDYIEQSKPEQAIFLMLTPK